MRYLVYSALLIPLVAMPSASQEKKRKHEPDPLMVAKLAESKNLLEGLTLNDAAKVQKSAEELLRISKSAQMRKALNTPAYDVHANNFQRQAEAIIEKAKAKKLEGAALDYVDMTITCIRCHQYTREQGIGRLNPPKDINDAIGR